MQKEKKEKKKKTERLEDKLAHFGFSIHTAVPTCLLYNSLYMYMAYSTE